MLIVAFIRFLCQRFLRDFSPMVGTPKSEVEMTCFYLSFRGALKTRRGNLFLFRLRLDWAMTKKSKPGGKFRHKWQCFAKFLCAYVHKRKIGLLTSWKLAQFSLFFWCYF